MQINYIHISKLINNEDNPRFIRDDMFQKLVKSIEKFPKMLKLRPIITDTKMVVIGGNMRLRACQALGMKKVPVLIAEDFTDEEIKEFIIKDNLGYGQWDYEIIANLYDLEEVKDWGLEVWDHTEANFLDVDEEEKTNSSEGSPGKASDDDYSKFELVMLHENKLLFTDTLNRVKNEFQFEKLEEALMEIVRVFNKSKTKK